MKVFPGFFWAGEDQVQIKGDGPSGLDFPATTATVNPNTGDAAVTNVQSVEALPNHVYRYDPLFIDWYISHDEGASWFGPFKSGNEVFVTLGNPLGDPGANPPVPGCQVPFRTVLYLATEGSAATTESQCVSDTWANFSGLDASPWGETKRIASPDRSPRVALAKKQGTWAHGDGRPTTC